MNARRDLEQVVRQGLTLDLGTRGFEPSFGGHPPRHSAVLILFGDATDGPSVLLTRRAPGLRHHASQIAFPGGGVEAADRGPEDTAVREAVEETGVDAGGIEVLGTLAPIPLPVSNNLVTPVLGWCQVPGAIAPDGFETTEVWYVPVADLLDPSARVTSLIVHGGITQSGPAFVFCDGAGEHLVWGFTGMLLSKLFDHAGWTRPWRRERLMEVKP